MPSPAGLCTSTKKVHPTDGLVETLLLDDVRSLSAHPPPESGIAPLREYIPTENCRSLELQVQVERLREEVERLRVVELELRKELEQARASTAQHRRKSSVLISPQLGALQMRSRFLFIPYVSCLFNGSGYKALVFESYQFPLTLLQCSLCFIVLAVNYFYEPMVKTVESSIGNSALLTINPVGHSVFVMTGTLSSVMLCSMTAVFASTQMSDWRCQATLVSWFAFLASTYATFIWLISRSLKLKTSLYCIDIFLLLAFYIAWQIGRLRVDKWFAETNTLRYPRVRVLQDTPSLTPQRGATANVIMTSTLLPISLLLGKKRGTAAAPHVSPLTAASSLVLLT